MIICIIPVEIRSYRRMIVLNDYISSICRYQQWLNKKKKSFGFGLILKLWIFLVSDAVIFLNLPVS